MRSQQLFTGLAVSDHPNSRYDLKGLASFRGQRYDQCHADNGQFHFGINAV